jgi:hypothetical protein
MARKSITTTTTTLIAEPSFRNTQQVAFVGGAGIIRGYKADAGIWTYLIEMALGPEPQFGRVGAETMIVLTEADLCAV